MNQYVFTLRSYDPVGVYVEVVHNGKNVAQLNLFDRLQRKYNCEKLEGWLGERAALKLVAFGETALLNTEEPLTF